MTLRLTPMRARRLLRPALALVVTLGLAAAGWSWLRDSSLVRVRDVDITGVSASDGARVQAALEAAARNMTTLHVREQALRDAVAPYSSVAGLRVRTDFPHRVAIEVLEQRPVAALALDDRRIPVTGSGLLLRGVTAERDLPSIRLERVPIGRRITDARALAALAVAGAAPAPLLGRTDRMWFGRAGLVLGMRDGPELLFGSDADARLKWAAAARVLAEPSAAGATYLDLRIPGRVAAGGLAPVPIETPEPDPQLETQNGPTVNP